MRVGAERPVAHLSHQRAAAQPLAEPRAQHDGVEEAPDESFRLAARAAGNGSPDQQVVLAGIPVQQGREPRLECHEQRGLFLPSQRFHPIQQGTRQLEALGRAAEALHRGTGLVRGQIEHEARPRQLVFPIRDLLLEHGPLQPGALPAGEVGVLNRQLGQRWTPRVRAVVVQLQDFLVNQLHRPLVGDDVVNRQQQPVIRSREMDHGRAKQRCAGQIERLAPVVPHDAQPRPLALRVRQRAQIELGERYVDRGRDDLLRVPVALRERGAQHVVAARQLQQRAPQRIPVVRPAQGDHVDDVVYGTAWRQLIQEPELLLGERERARSTLRAPHDARRGAPPRPLGVGQDRRDVADGRVLEQGAGLQVHAEDIADPRHGPDGQQRVPAQVEEVVRAADVFHLQELGPNGRDGLLGLGERRRQLVGRLGALERDGRQRLAIHFPVRGQGKLVQQNEGRRNHVLRQPCLQMFAQRRGRQDFSVGGQLRAHECVGGLVSNESPPLGRRPDRVHVAQLGMSQQRVLLDHHVKAVTLEQLRDRLDMVVLIHLDHRLADLGPIVRVDTAQHVQLALFDVDLEQVDSLDALLRDHAGESAQPRRYRPRAEAVFDHVAHIRDEALVVGGRRLLIEHVALDHLALRRGIGVEAREQRQALEPREVRGPAFAGQPER